MQEDERIFGAFRGRLPSESHREQGETQKEISRGKLFQGGIGRAMFQFG